MNTPQLGVEEEFLLVEADTGYPAPRVDDVMPNARRLAGEYTEPELHRAQIETASRPCTSLIELTEQLEDHRRALAQAAAQEGVVVVASGTFPGVMGESGRLITDKKRYEIMLQTNSLVAREQLICGCHVHVTVEDDQDRVRVLNQMRRDLHCLIALSANSPFWEGEDSGFASFRTEVWTRWPTAGPPGTFSDVAEYSQLIEKLVQARVILDEGMAYWDVRLSRQYPTVEIRIADVGLEVEDSVTVAGLTRALVMNCLREPRRSEEMRHELLRAASWKAARTAIRGELIDPRSGIATAAADYFDDLLSRLSPDLSESGDLDVVEQGIRRILRTGTGADRQRAASDQGRDLGAVIELASLVG